MTKIVDYDRPMTPDQVKMVEDNYGLIYGYAKRYNLDLKEEYGLLAIGLIRGVHAWFQNKETNKYKFSTIAFWQMKTMVCNDRRSENRHNVPTVSYDAILSSLADNRIAGLDRFLMLMRDEKADDEMDNILSEMDKEVIIRHVRKVLSSLPEDLQIVAGGLIENKTQMEMAAEIGTSQTSIVRKIKKLYKILSVELEGVCA